MYKPLQLQAPQTGNAKNPPLNLPSPRELVLGKLPSNTNHNKAKTVNLLPTIWLAQSILKHKFPSVDKPLQK